MLSMLTQAKPSILRLGILLLLFDVYLTWARIEKQLPSQATAANGMISSLGHASGHLAAQPIGLQYIFFRKSSRSH